MAISNIPRSYQFYSAVSATQPDFNLDAGNYGLTLGWTAGSVQLQRLVPDGVGTNYTPVTAALAASGYTYLQLPAGQYRLVIVTGPATLLLEKIDAGRGR